MSGDDDFSCRGRAASSGPPAFTHHAMAMRQTFRGANIAECNPQMPWHFAKHLKVLWRTEGLCFRLLALFCQHILTRIRGTQVNVGDLVIVDGRFGKVTKKVGLPWSSDWEVRATFADVRACAAVMIEHHHSHNIPCFHGGFEPKTCHAWAVVLTSVVS